ncbi:hypothetical protein ACXJQ9_10355 (plasmid) [Lactobacillus johnsonii]
MAENRQDQIAKLQALENEDKQDTGKMAFRDLIVCHVGVPVKEHFPKVKKDGVTQKNDDGSDVRSKESDGFMYTFSQFGTATKVMVIIPKKYTLELLTAYKVSGLGYQMRQANMIYLDENVHLNSF